MKAKLYTDETLIKVTEFQLFKLEEAMEEFIKDSVKNRPAPTAHWVEREHYQIELSDAKAVMKTIKTGIKRLERQYRAAHKKTISQGNLKAKR